ncbi:ABC transporter, substrate-binding protein, aliphatic sulphonates [Zymobacter palmae]|uniref:ABC transporter, substrate-binding protein, aliphatic sulphonates n=1 Tax=Zymobacter palmae TaxID=33074 RepID=A0A348HHQ3_9GAMM|nr:ABC transporter, substrate-binding protein, aliphatic sulphonates [Zymobacter palmae]
MCHMFSAMDTMKDAVCGLRSAVCGLRSAVCGLRSAVCGLRSAVCNSKRHRPLSCKERCRFNGKRRQWLLPSVY